MSALWWTLLAAVCLDRVLGEPHRWHPLVGFGQLADRLEQRWNRRDRSPGRLRWLGGLAWLLLVLPLPAALWWLLAEPYLSPGGTVALSAVVLWLCLGWQSLRQHGLAVGEAFRQQGLPAAREQVGRIVSRDTDGMDETAVARASIESILENGSDAIFAPLFWFVLLGPAGALAYRLANTLDAMWGYRTERLQHFGYCSARLDDLLNWVPARLTACSYALLGKTAAAWRCWRTQAATCASSNGGPVMCSGAGALGLELGGGAFYHGQWQSRPLMGTGRPARMADIERSLQLVGRSLLLWLLVLLALTPLVPILPVFG